MPLVRAAPSPYFGYVQMSLGNFEELYQDYFPGKVALTDLESFSRNAPLWSRSYLNCFAFAWGVPHSFVSFVQENEQRLKKEIFSFHLPEPGTAGGKPFSLSAMTGGVCALQESLKADKFEPWDQKIEGAVSGSRHLVSAHYYFCNNRMGLPCATYHFCRLTKEGWRHVAGWTGHASALDRQFARIEDPSKAAFDYPYEWAGNFTSPSPESQFKVFVEDADGNALYGNRPLRVVQQPAPTVKVLLQH